jgi:hypothetical protein
MQRRFKTVSGVVLMPVAILAMAAAIYLVVLKEFLLLCKRQMHKVLHRLRRRV